MKASILRQTASNVWRFKPATVKEWLAWSAVFFVVQGSAMYLCIRIIGWDLFVSAFVTAAVAVGLSNLTGWIVRRHSVLRLIRSDPELIKWRWQRMQVARPQGHRADLQFPAYHR
jgi:hypothetical protein